MLLEKLPLLVGTVVADEFESVCCALLAEASALWHNPVDGAGARVAPEDRLRLAAGDFLVACGLLRKFGFHIFFITEQGQMAAERLEQYYAART